MPPANNQSTSTTANGSTDSYSYDGNGDLLTMPQFASMSWDFVKDQLQATQTQVVTDGTGQRTFYIYDAAGQRVRKVTESANGAVSYERIYLGSFEVYREYGGTGVMTLERQTLHVMDDRQRIALVWNITEGSNGSPSQLVRYQFSNRILVPHVWNSTKVLKSSRTRSTTLTAVLPTRRATRASKRRRSAIDSPARSAMRRTGVLLPRCALLRALAGPLDGVRSGRHSGRDEFIRLRSRQSGAIYRPERIGG